MAVLLLLTSVIGLSPRACMRELRLLCVSLCSRMELRVSLQTLK